MIDELENLTGLMAEVGQRARAAGVEVISRAQVRSSRRVFVRGGKVESAAVGSIAGQGLQVITAEGRSVLGSRDDFTPEPTLALLDRLIETAGRGQALGLQTSAWPAGLEPVRARRLPGDRPGPDSVQLDQVGKRLMALERSINGAVPGTSIQMSFRSEREGWRIGRSDGTDVLFVIPRCTLGMRATSTGASSRHGVIATVFFPHPDMLDDEATVDCFLKRAQQAARLALELPDAPNHPAGSFPLVIDYALAKGLAHEAFGHASEADGFRSSILADQGRFRSGELVGAESFSIIDEPIEDDHAWQPFSANGLRRERATLVENGRLKHGLSDPWSAAAGGVPITGAARSESFRDAPQPRMTNIRIETADPLPAPGEFEDYGPDEVRELLGEAGVFRRHPKVVFLSGYSGGQVNTATGDFVFNCKAIYDLDSRGSKIHKPAIFSGSMFGALQSLREAFGPLKLDATGYCGKWGQSVPSSGGSHYFLVLDPDPTVRLGGS